MPRTTHMKEEPEYEEDLYIDPDGLDVEWLSQAQIFMKWSEKSADARARVDRAKMKLDVVEAELGSDVRANPLKYGLEKITESAIRAAILQSDEYDAAMQELISFRHESDILASAVRAFDQRKTALENLVRLQGQNYFAGPSEPRDLHHESKTREAQRAVGTKRVKERRDQRRTK